MKAISMILIYTLFSNILFAEEGSAAAQVHASFIFNQFRTKPTELVERVFEKADRTFFIKQFQGVSELPPVTLTEGQIKFESQGKPWTLLLRSEGLAINGIQISVSKNESNISLFKKIKARVTEPHAISLFSSEAFANIWEIAVLTAGMAVVLYALFKQVQIQNNNADIKVLIESTKKACVTAENNRKLNHVLFLKKSESFLEEFIATCMEEGARRASNTPCKQLRKSMACFLPLVDRSLKAPDSLQGSEGEHIRQLVKRFTQFNADGETEFPGATIPGAN